MSEIIILSKVERLILANQYDILSRLDKKDPDYYARTIEALSSGYVSAYQSILDHMYDGLPAEECSFVIMTMAMYDAIQHTYSTLDDKSGVEEWATKFHGFDGNNETEYMSYARFVIKQEQRFTDLILGNDGLNSHMRRVSSYREMRKKWKAMDETYDLTKEQLIELLK